MARSTRVPHAVALEPVVDTPAGDRPPLNDCEAVGERGSALVDFTLVSILVVAVVMGLMQLAFALYTRNVIIDAAGAGARRAALDGATVQDAQRRIDELLESSLSADVVESVSVSRETREGIDLVTVHIDARLPLLGTLGPSSTLHADGHAIDERAFASSTTGTAAP